MKRSQQSISKKDANSFDKHTLTITHLLHPYVKQRLRVAENFGIIPKNMYQSNGIIDEVILNVYENRNENIDIGELRMKMFDLTNKKLTGLFETEKWHKDTISTKFILEKELNQLEENFTIDGDNELIMNEELDDISYHQNDHEVDYITYDDAHINALAFLEIKNLNTQSRDKYQKNVNNMYRMLPLQTSNVVDLYVLGKLNLKEIANVLDTDIVEVKRIVDFVKENFKKHLS